MSAPGVRALRLLCGLLASLALTLPLKSTEREGEAEADGLESYVDGLVASQIRSENVPGISLSIVKDGRVALAKGYGYADLEKRTPVSSGTLFRLGSISKLFTWTATMQLAEQGRLDAHADVNRYLGEASLPKTPYRPVTLADLMTHRAGFEAADLGYDFFADAGKVPGLDGFVREHRPALVREPGLITSYSNYGATLTGYVVQRVSRQPYPDYVEQHVFAPLDMRSTTFREPRQAGRGTRGDAMAPALASRTATGYARVAGRQTALPHEYIYPAAAPAGSAYSTADDMARFMLLHLGHGGREAAPVLRPGTIALMRKREYADRADATDFAHGFFNGRMAGYQTYGHTGAMIGFKSALVLVPELDLGVYVAVNSAQGWPVANDLPRLIVDRFAKQRPTQNGSPSTVFEPSLDRFSGRYFGVRRSYTKLEKLLKLQGADAKVSVTADAKLVIARGADVRTWTAVAPLTFQELGGDDIVRFVADREGRIVRFYPPAGHEAYERMGWATSPALLFAAILAAALLALAMLPTVWRTPKPGRQDGKRLSWLTTGVAVLTIAFAVLFLLAMRNLSAEGIGLMFSWPTPALLRMTAAAKVLVLATLVMLATLWPLWRSRQWTLWARIQATSFALSLCLLVSMLYQWNVFASPYN
ncbi:MAG TPA: serine hydrolase [Pseudoxanthomonas sp.]